MFRRFLSTPDEPALAIVRVTVGTVILAHGLQKLFGWFGGHGPQEVLESFQRWFGLPYALTALVIAAESLGALALILGFASRFTAAAIGAVMIGAIALVTGKSGFFMNWYSEAGRGEGYELHVLVLGMVLAIVWRGGGSGSVDRWLLARLERRRPR